MNIILIKTYFYDISSDETSDFVGTSFQTVFLCSSKPDAIYVLCAN